MKSLGMARKVDDLGRIVLPVELRRLFAIAAGDELEIHVDGGDIVLRKLEKRCVFCGGPDDLAVFRGKQVCESCGRELRGDGPADVVASVGVGDSGGGDAGGAGGIGGAGL